MRSDRNNIRPNTSMETEDENNDILTMAFVNFQPLGSMYSPDEALENGTLFENLNKPFLGGNASC